jgi:hypothetical protein
VEPAPTSTLQTTCRRSRSGQAPTSSIDGENSRVLIFACVDPQERVLERFVTILERLFSSLSHHQSPATATALPPLWELPKKPPSRQPSRATRSPRGGPPLHAVALDTPRYAMLRSFSPAPPHAAAPLGPPSRQPHTSPPTNPYSPSSATVRAMPPPSPIPLWPMDTLATIGVRPAELLSDNQVGSCAAAPQQRGPSSVLREMRRSGVQFFGSSQGVTPITPRKPPAVPRPRLASERSSATGAYLGGFHVTY